MSVNVGTDLLKQLRSFKTRATTSAPKGACRAMGQAGETAVKVTLTSSSHKEGTPTPSRPGQPPSLVSGKLRRSVTRTQPERAGPYTFICLVGPTVIYARPQEYGATIHAGASGYLANRRTGQFFVTPYSSKDYVTLPARPFMRPTAVKLAYTGLASKAAAAGWLKAMGL